MTLREYLEARMRQYAKAAQEAHDDTEKYQRFLGRYDAYVDILLLCQDQEDILRRKVTYEVR